MEIIEIKVRDDQVMKQLAELRAKMVNLTPIMRKIAGMMADSVEENFAKEGRPAWKPSHRAIKYGGKTLQKDGGLAKSILPQATQNKAIVGTNKEYAGLMQFGARKGQFGTKTVEVDGQVRFSKAGKRYGVRPHTRKQTLPWGDIPARPFLMVQDKDWAEIKQALTRYLFTL